MVCFVLVTLRAGYPANLSTIRRFKILTDLRSAKIRFFTTLSRKRQMVRFVLVTLKAALAAILSSIRRF